MDCIARRRSRSQGLLSRSQTHATGLTRRTGLQHTVEVRVPPGPPPSQAGSGTTGESPAVTEQMGDFSWTDLMAVGDFAMNGTGAATGQSDENSLWPGFLPLDMGMGMSGQGVGWENGGFDGGELVMAF